MVELVAGVAIKVDASQPRVGHLQQGAAGQLALDAEVVLLCIGVPVGGFVGSDGKAQ